ncbi:MAG TPA: creatininase family protein [Candidatus Acidoferrales bacterium]|nr:creatininase family protein [Candidatus Acidoferrales bacterium]
MSDFERLNGENVREEAGRGTLVLPVGSVEQHGPHLPLTVDIEIPGPHRRKGCGTEQGICGASDFLWRALAAPEWRQSRHFRNDSRSRESADGGLE